MCIRDRFERFDLLLQFSHVGAFPATRLQLFDLLFEAGNLVVPFIHALLERFNLLLQFSHVSAFSATRLQIFDLLFEAGNFVVHMCIRDSLTCCLSACAIPLCPAFGKPNPNS